ncbi:hypothetical protein WSM22_09860 [Cytophagales bacterium WSM2-2]|nr:hypothetical protein WSM22_09860 [Cytophagales bacterium WSM2-2]
MKFLVGLGCVVIAALILFSNTGSHGKIISAPEKPKGPSSPDPNKIFIFSDPNPSVNLALKEFESFIKMTIANKQAPGAALAIVKDTSIIFLKGFGLREAGKPDSVDSRTIFRVGSVSKSITATLASILVNEGIIHWDDQVIKYLPRFRLKTEDATKKLTLRHLLSHTEGLPYHAYTDMVELRTPIDTLISHLKGLNLIADPGQIHSYQNVGFSLIGKVIEAATKKSFDEVLREKLFQPLHMNDASSTYQKISESKNAALPHRFTQPGEISDTYYSVAPAGGVNASARDMGLWLKEIMTQKSNVLKEARLKEIFEPQVSAVTHNYFIRRWKKVDKAYYGLGWRVITFKDDTILYHGGLVNNYRCEVAISTRHKIAMALLVNSTGMLADQGVSKFLMTYETYMDSANSRTGKTKSSGLN